jgi:putative tryptophan/tyrosine transport system substrate-binding protein
MKRREFITLLGGATLFTPSFVHGQDTRTYRLGMLNAQGRSAPNLVAFFDELRQLGFIEGHNLIVDGRGYAAPTDQFPALAIDLANQKLDAIICGGPAATRAAQQATHTIPILTILDDIVAAGIVGSLARPGGNTTGISFLATELDGKRQGLLMELVPGSRRMAALVDANTTAMQRLQALRDDTRARGVELADYVIDRPERIVPAIDEAKRSGAEALNVLASPVLNARRMDIFDRTVALRLPAIYQWPESAEEGGLIAYGPRLAHIYRQMARQLGKILRGAKPGEVPVEQPTAFELIVNTGVAKTMGFELPASLVLRADKVIE